MESTAAGSLGNELFALEKMGLTRVQKHKIS